jgi:hypothetical protein
LKRDMDLVRELLLKLESLPMEPGDALTLMPESPAVAIEGHSTAEIGYHLSLILEAGFVEDVGSHPMMGITFTRLSWRGHEFLDTIRSPQVWRETKSGLAKIGGASVELAWEIAKAYGKHLAIEKLGLDIQ